MASLVIKSVNDEPEQRIVYAEVYAPNRPDSDGEYMTAETIRKMAHDFARNNRFAQVDCYHNNEVTPGVVVIESFIARKGDPDGFLEGAWVVGVHIPDDDIWDKVKKGEINGFSMEAFVVREEQEVEIQIPPVVSGTTSKSEDHEHHFFVSFDKDGNFMGGVTDEVNGHRHVIKAGTVTEKFEGHNHRFSAVDQVLIVSAS